VNRGFINGKLHTYGGILFFMAATVLWAPLVRLVRRLD
jgi:hypothetical protein